MVLWKEEISSMLPFEASEGEELERPESLSIILFQSTIFCLQVVRCLDGVFIVFDRLCAEIDISDRVHTHPTVLRYPYACQNHCRPISGHISKEPAYQTKLIRSSNLTTCQIVLWYR